MNDDAGHSLNIGTVLNDKWVILEFIGKGGMGEVYRAHQANLKRDIAIKVISQDWLESLGDDPEEIENAFERFRREVHTMAQVRHPNVLQIFDYDTCSIKKGEAETSLEYIAMEYVPGNTLRSTMLEDGFYPDENATRAWVRDYFLPILDGVQTMHEQGVVHRDLKPENVLLDKNIPRIADFGLARSSQLKSVTQSIDAKGSPLYMSPEHYFDFKGTDQRADIYSLGKILYEAMDGKLTPETLPFKSASLEAPKTLFFKELDRIIQEATAEDKEARIKSVEALRKALLETLDMSTDKKTAGKKRLKLMGLVLAALFCLGAAAAGVWNFYFRPPPIELASAERMSFPLPDKASIAVLPFTNLSGDPEQEFVSDGLTEEIITALSKTPKLFVIARNSTFTYKGKPVKVKQIAEDLGVRYVLEGSFRKSGDRVRITAQLIDALTGHHLWADRYDRELKDIFAVQDEITMKIITALQVKLTAGEQARLSAKGTDNLDAYLKYLAGCEHLLRFNKDDNLLARQRAEEAMALDPEYSNAYSLLGKTHILDVWFKWSKSPKESIGHAFELAKKALALDESNFHAHRTLSHVYLLKRQHDKAIAECERAVLLAPNSADDIYNSGIILRFSGRAKEAIPMHERAIRLNPMPPASYLYQLGLCYTFIGEFEKAIAICKKALDQNPNDLVGRITLTIAYSSLGREEEARAEAAEVLRIHPKFTVEYASKTWPYKNQADRDLVFRALRKAGVN